MRSVKNAAYLLVPLSLGTYAYSSYVHSHRKKKLHYDTSHFSDYYTQFIKQNDLVVPNFYYKLKRDSNVNSFFFKAILNTVGGLDQFSIYTDKKLNDIINKDIDLSDEERKKAIENAKLYCIFSANNKVENHDNVVHAGFTATLLDNMGGTLAFLSCGNKPVATASITVNYHKPIMTGEEYLTEVSSKKIDHNNVIVQGIIKDKNGVVFADADLMFIKVDWKNMVFSNILKNITEKVMGKTDEMERKESRPPFVYMNVPDIVIDFQTDPKRKFRIGERYAKFC